MSDLLGYREFEVKIRLVERLLGTVPKSREVYSNYIATKGRELLAKQQAKGVPHASGEPVTTDSATALLDEEVETIAEVEDKGWTGFHSDEDGPFLFDYAIKGFLSESARTIAKQIEKAHGLKQLQDKLKRYVFVSPRRIRLPPIEAAPLERPLRAMTAQGPRVTLARSDTVAAGGEIAFSLRLLAGVELTPTILKKVLAYGELIGLGQWRSGSHGRFSVEVFKEVS